MTDVFHAPMRQMRSSPGTLRQTVPEGRDLRGVVDGIRIARRINARLGAMLAEELTIRAGALSPGRIWRRRTLARPISPFRPRRIAFRPTGWTRSASLQSAFIG